MNETATTIDAAAPALPRLRHVAAELDRRLFVAGVAACTAARRGVPPGPAVGLAAARGRDTAAVRRPATDRRPLRHRPRQARRGPVALPPRLDRGARGRRPRDHALLLRAVRGGEHPGDRRLGNRLAGRGPALAACVLAAASWMLLFHGIYARMYSLFLFLSTLSYLALLRATERGGKRAWTLWAVVMLLTIGSHPYGALVLGSQGSTSWSPAAGSARPSSPSASCSCSPSRSGAAVSCSAIVWRSVWRRRRQAAHASGGVRVPLARGRRRLDRLRRRPRDRARVRGVRPRLAGAETAAQRAPHGLRRDHADGLLPLSAGSAGTRRPSRAT